MKKSNPPTVILANWDLPKVYHKALEKDHSAIDSLMTRVQVVEIMEGHPLDIDGFREALALASAATIVTPITSQAAVDLTVTTSQSLGESVVDLCTSETHLESPICTPPSSPNVHSVAYRAQQDAIIQSVDDLVPATPNPHQMTLTDDDLLDVPVADGTRQLSAYERFQNQLREKRRPNDRESSIDRMAKKTKSGTMFTGYN